MGEANVHYVPQPFLNLAEPAALHIDHRCHGMSNRLTKCTITLRQDTWSHIMIFYQRIEHIYHTTRSNDFTDELGT